MIIDEQFEEFRKFKQWQEFADEVAEQLQHELETKWKSDTKYSQKMKAMVKSLSSISKAQPAADK